MLAGDVMSNHSNPRMYWQPMSLDTEALLAAVSAASTYIPCLAAVQCTQHWIWKQRLEVSERLLSPRAPDGL